MATEYKDGTFGETLPIDEALEEFQNACEDGTAKALHVGTYDEIELERAKADFRRDLQKSMEELNKQADKLQQKDKDEEKPNLSEEISKILNK